MTERLLEGYQRFRKGYFREQKSHLGTLTKGQSPKVALVSCCDSRVDPGILFDATPGDIFVVRNVANLVPPWEPDGLHHGTSAALEFAVTKLGVEHLVVLGHANCGGIRALMEHSPDAAQDSFIARWMDIAAAAKKEVLGRKDLQGIEAQCHACEQAAVRISLRNLMSFPWIRSAVTKGQLSLHGWYYDLHDGLILQLEDGMELGQSGD